MLSYTLYKTIVPIEHEIWAYGFNSNPTTFLQSLSSISIIRGRLNLSISGFDNSPFLPAAHAIYLNKNMNFPIRVIQAKRK